MDEEIKESIEATAATPTTPILEGQSLFIPKDDTGYSVPDAGTAIIEFAKLSEDDSGCTIKVTSFEGEEVADINATDDTMEDAMDHAESFIAKREKQQADEGSY